MQFFQVVLATAAITTASAFLAASPQTTSTITALNAADLNGWVPDESKFAFGLPGTLDPVEDFDPLGFANDADLQQMKGYREAETTHGRVAMLAVVGFLVTEGPVSFHPLFDTASKDIGPAIRHLDEVRASTPFFFEILAIVIGAAEFGRSLAGWEKPGNEENLALKVDYYPGKCLFSFSFSFSFSFCVIYVQYFSHDYTRRRTIDAYIHTHTCDTHNRQQLIYNFDALLLIYLPSSSSSNIPIRFLSFLLFVLSYYYL